jgi:glutamine synthetase
MASGEKSKDAISRPGGPGGTAGMLSLDDLRKEAEEGTIDTVVTAFTDMQGRLFGKRIQIEYFLDEVTDHGVEGCNYLLALDMEMEPVPGYEMANWEDGYGDFGIEPDMSTLRRIPWLDRTALVLADVVNHDGSPVVASPRQILIAQYERAAEMGYTPYFASELEFYLYKESYAEAHEKDYQRLTPTIPYILDYHVLATTMDEAYLGPIRRGMQGAGIPVEFSKGEAWHGQHEVNFRYADAVTSADRHTIYKNGVKEIAFLNEISASFMAKPSEKDIGSSCHIHSSLQDKDGNSVFVDDKGEETDTFRNYLGGLRNHIKELALFIAPSVNSYKRYAAESWAPTSVSWGRDNRTCGFRIVGHGQSRRVECRIPGADANPYLAFAALLATGLDGIENQTDPGPELKGNAYEAGEAEPFPSALREAKELWENSQFVRNTFGESVQKHYSNYARYEQQEFDQVVTDYERRRMFERG